MRLNYTMKNYKRQWRELSDETKERISQSLRDYWRGVPHKPGNEDMTMDEFLGVDDGDKDNER